MRKFSAVLIAVLLPVSAQAASDVSSLKTPSRQVPAMQVAGLSALIDKSAITMQGDVAMQGDCVKSVAINVGTGEVPGAAVLVPAAMGGLSATASPP